MRIKFPCDLLKRRWLSVFVFGCLLITPGVGNGGIIHPAAQYDAPNVFVIAIGINTYRNQHLKYARADAIAVSNAIEKAYPQARIHKYVVLDEKATRHYIAAAFEKVIAASRPDDIFVLHFSGYHSFEMGKKSEREFYLLTTDVNLGERSQKILSSRAISASLLKSWTTRIQAGRQLLILDTCYAEKVVTGFKEFVKSEGIRALELSGRKIMILALEGLTYEDPALGQGWLTFTLLKGLAGEADAWPKDGLITAGELDIYLRSQALQASRYKLQIASAAIGEDFVVAELKDSRGVGVSPIELQARNSRDEPKGRDYALLIATDNYKSYKHLSNPINDARAIATDLRDIYGFETRLLENPSLEDIFKVLGEYIENKYSPNDQLFIFIAGHGMYIENTKEGFLIANNSKPRQEDIYGTTYIPHTRIRDIIDRISTKHIFLIIDACFGGTFDQRIADAGDRADDFYAEVSALEVKARKMKYKSRRYLTSGGKEYVPDGRPGQHSPFARKILEALRSYGGKEGYLTIGKILQYVEKITPEPRAGEFGNQEPGGDFVLIKK